MSLANRVGRVARYALSRKRFQGFFRKMYQLSLSGMNIGHGGDSRSSGEIAVLEYIKKKSAHKGSLVIFDVGASGGDYSMLLIKAFNEQAEIYSFEPSEQSYQKLSQTLPQKKNIHIYNFGFSNEERSATLFSGANAPGWASLYKRRVDHFNVYLNKTEQVRVRMIDNFCKEEGIGKIDFLKLDIEGHELQALEGAREMLASGSIDFIQFEFGGCNIDSRTFFQDFYYLLKDQFYIYRIIRDGLYPIEKYEEIWECFMTTNFLAEKK